MSDDFFGDLGKSISQATQQAANKTSVFFESQKISNKIANEQREVEKLYQQIGEEVYQRADECGHMGPKIDEKIASVKARLDKISDMKKNLASVKGMKLCPKCGEPVDLSTSFCPKCGTAIPAPEANEKASAESAAPKTDFAADAAPEEAGCKMHEDVKEAVDQAKKAVEEENKQ